MASPDLEAAMMAYLSSAPATMSADFSTVVTPPALGALLDYLHSPLTDACEAVAEFEEGVAQLDARRAGAAPAFHASDLCADLAAGIVSAQAASFASYVEELQSSVGEELAAAAAGAAGSSGGGGAEAAAAAAAPPPTSRALRLRSAQGFSILSPRTDEEVGALRDLARSLDAASAASSLAPAAAAEGEEGAAAPAPAPASSPSPISAAAATAAADLECAAVERSYRVLRLLTGGSAHAEHLLETRMEDLVRRAFDVFSSRSRGSPHHACALLQRCLQHSPDALVGVLVHDSQRYLGSLLPYLHLSVVADLLVQLVTLTHTASASGGAGPSAALGAPGGGGGGGGGAGGAGGGFLSGLGRNALLGGFGGGWGQGGASGFGARGSGGGGGGGGTSFSGPLGLYSQRGTPASHAALPALHRSLSGWGFLAVLSAHVYRAEFAACPEHVAGAGGALGALLRAASHDDRYDALLLPLASCPALLAGLCAGACGVAGALASGVDYSAEGSGSGGAAVAPRQAECMRALRTLQTLAFTEHVYAGGEAGVALAAATAAALASGAGVPAGSMPRLVPCRLAPYAGLVARSLVACLPRLGACLVALHHASHPGLVLLGEGSGEGGKRRGKKAKKAKKRASCDSATAAAAGAGRGGGEEEGEEEGEEGAGAGGRPAAASSAGGSAATSPSVAPAPAKQPSIVLPGVYAAPARAAASGSAAGPAAAVFPHPGHAYAAQFGSFRLAACEVIAALASREAAVGVVERLGAGEERASAASASAAAAAAAAAPGGGKEVEGQGSGKAGVAAAEAEAVAAPLAAPHFSPTHAHTHAHSISGAEGSSSGSSGAATSSSAADSVRNSASKAAKAVSSAVRGLGKGIGSLMGLTPGAGEGGEEGEQALALRSPGSAEGGSGAAGASARATERCCTAALDALTQPAALGGAPGAPTHFSPSEFWLVLTQWVLLYPHTNFYHGVFAALVRGVLRARHEPAITCLLRPAKLVTCFMQHYLNTAPPGLHVEGGAGSASVSSSGGGGGGGSGATLGASRAASSSARGHLLRVLSMLRVAAGAFPPSAVLPSYLRDHDSWTGFQARLEEDTRAHLLLGSGEAGVGGGGLGARPRLMGGGGAGGGSGGGTLAALQQMFAGKPNALASLLSGKGRRGGGRAAEAEEEAAGAASAGAAAAVPGGLGEGEWDLGSAAARDLGLEGMAAWVGSAGSSSSSSGSGSAASSAAQGKRAGGGGAGSSGAAPASGSPPAHPPSGKQLPPKGEVRERAASKGSGSESSLGSGALGLQGDDSGGNSGSSSSSRASPAAAAGAQSQAQAGQRLSQAQAAGPHGSGAEKSSSGSPGAGKGKAGSHAPSSKDAAFLSDSSGLLGVD